MLDHKDGKRANNAIDNLQLQPTNKIIERNITTTH